MARSPLVALITLALLMTSSGTTGSDGVHEDIPVDWYCVIDAPVAELELRPLVSGTATR